MATGNCRKAGKFDMNDRWKPVGLALDVIIMTLPVVQIFNAHGKYAAGFVDWGDIAWALAYMVVFSIAVVELYNHFTGRS